MRIILTTLLIVGLSLLIKPFPLHAQATVKGSVSDSTNGSPLDGVNVFLSGTMLGTATDSNGQYQLEGLPPGHQKLVISIIGYRKKTVDINMIPNESKIIDFKLKPVVYEMPEIFVGNLDKHWKERLEQFTNLFIGESKWADSVKILNPEVLRFEKHFLGPFRAEAMAPLQVENRALGYHITYYLDEFNHSGSRTRWDGEPFFTELEPADSTQATYWEHNRREAFLGSQRHFLLALMHNRVEEEGFILYRIRRDIYGLSSKDGTRISAFRLIKKSTKNYFHKMNFFGRLKIIYLREQEDWPYLQWIHAYQRGPNGTQTSYLELNEHPITIEADGEITEPYGATVFGHFAYERLADLTPREYRPNGFFDSTQTADSKRER